jgi:hypothetical protein
MAVKKKKKNRSTQSERDARDGADLRRFRKLLRSYDEEPVELHQHCDHSEYQRCGGGRRIVKK